MAELRTRIVLRNDSTANWLSNESVILLKGEVGIEFLSNGQAKMKIGDGVKTWAQLPYFGGEEAHVYEAIVAKGGDHIAAITTALNGATPNAHDIAIVKEAVISEDALTKTKNENAEQKYQYTAYRYNGANWAAMDGNYSAENVYFTEDFTFTTKIGTVQTLTNGSATVAAAGKNLKEFFAGLFAAEQNPTKTDPSVSVTLTGAGAYEVGSVVTPSYTATFDYGKYTYGPKPTGATVESWAVTSTDSSEIWTTATGDCKSITVADDTNYYVTAKATHTAGAYGKTNIGNDSAIQIAAGTKSKTSSAITGYRSYFYGVLDTSTVDAPLTSAIIRDNLTNGGAYDAEKSFTLNGSATAKRIVIAIPSSSTRGGLSEVILTSAMNTPVTDSYTKTEKAVKVEGKDGYAAVDYDVYVYEPSKIDAGEVHAIKLA